MKRQTWCCDVCKEAGSVEFPSTSDAISVAKHIMTEHSRQSPECRGTFWHIHPVGKEQRVGEEVV